MKYKQLACLVVLGLMVSVPAVNAVVPILAYAGAIFIGGVLGGMVADFTDDFTDTTEELEYQVTVSEATAYFQSNLIALDLSTRGKASLDMSTELLEYIPNYVWSKAKYEVLKGMEQGDYQVGLLNANTFIQTFYKDQTQFFLDQERATITNLNATADVTNNLQNGTAKFGYITVSTTECGNVPSGTFYGEIWFNFGSYNVGGCDSGRGRASASTAPYVQPVETTVVLGTDQLPRLTTLNSNVKTIGDGIYNAKADVEFSVYKVYDRRDYDYIYSELETQRGYMASNLNLYATELAVSQYNASALLMDPDVILAMTQDYNQTQDYTIGVAELAMLGLGVSGNYTDRYLVTVDGKTYEGIYVAEGNIEVETNGTYNQSGWIITNNGMIRLDGTSYYTIDGIKDALGNSLNSTTLIQYNAQSMNVSDLEAEIASLRDLLQQVIENEPTGGSGGAFGDMFGGVYDWIVDIFAGLGLDLTTIQDQVVVGAIVTLLIGFVAWGVKSLIPGG